MCIVYTALCIMHYIVYSIHYTVGVANLWSTGQMWPFLNSEEQKKGHQKNLEEMAKKYELMALNKKSLSFPHFLAHL